MNLLVGLVAAGLMDRYASLASSEVAAPSGFSPVGSPQNMNDMPQSLHRMRIPALNWFVSSNLFTFTLASNFRCGQFLTMFYVR